MRLIEKIGYGLLYGIAFLGSLIPMGILYVIAQLIFVVLYYIIGYRRDVVIQNISRSFPSMKYKEVSKVSRQFYVNFANYLVEIIKSISAPLSFYQHKITFINFEQVAQLISEGKTVLAGMGHVTNWEILNILPEQLNIPCVAVYKTQTSKGMDVLMHKIRSRFGMRLITSTDVAKHLLSKKDTNAMYVFIADQSPMYHNEDEKILFLNQRSQMFNGLEKIALKVKADVVYLKMLQTSRGHYTVECIYLGNATTLNEHGAITKAYTQQLEENIKEQPSSWLWTHKRWKRD